MDEFNIDSIVNETNTEDDNKKSNKRNKGTSLLFEWLDSIVLSLSIVVLLFSFAIRVVGIDGYSMLNTFNNNDRIIISNLFYTPSYGDVVVISRNVSNDSENYSDDNKPIIKRIIATGGQTVDIKYEKVDGEDVGVVYIDGNPIYESYIREMIDPEIMESREHIDFPVYVPEGYVFVMGDNRNDSLDSRSPYIGENGLVDERYIIGKALLRVYPFNKIGVVS